MRPRIQIVDEELIEEILTDAKRLLAEVGVEVRGQELHRRLLERGLERDSDSGRVLFQPHLVDKAIADTPRSFTLYDRAGNPHADLGDDRVHFVPGSSGLHVLDHRTNQTRPATTADFVEYVRLADGLEHIAYLATAFSTGDDVAVQVSDAWRLYLVLTNSLKPVVSGAFTEHGVPRMAEMMGLFRRDKAALRRRPMAIFTITATGHFRYGEDSCQNLLDCVEWGIPVEIVPVTLMGLIAPVTLVGATVFHIADVLAGLTMAQIIAPGTPVLFGGAPAAFHMQAATSPMMAIEALKLDVAYVAVAKSLGLPTQAYMALSDAKFVDAQAGAESFASALLAALAGINSVSGPGMLDFLIVFSLAKLVLDDELCGQALHFVRQTQPAGDLPVVDLARELLAEQHLVTAPHTLQYWPEHLYLPGQAVDRQNRENWARQGGKQLEQRLAAEVEERLARYEPVVTDSRLSKELRRIIQTGAGADQPLPDVPPPAGRPKEHPKRHRRRIRRK